MKGILVLHFSRPLNECGLIGIVIMRCMALSHYGQNQPTEITWDIDKQAMFLTIGGDVKDLHLIAELIQEQRGDGNQPSWATEKLPRKHQAFLGLMKARGRLNFENIANVELFALAKLQ